MTETTVLSLRDCKQSLDALTPRWRRLLHASEGYIQHTKRFLNSYLQQESAKAFPPALALLPGIGTPPYSLYRLTGFDRLHVMDLGIIRKYYGHLNDIFEQTENYCGGIPKSTIIAICNGRMKDLPPA